MKKRNNNPEDSAGLRQRAEEHIRSRKSEINATISETDMLKIIHELEVNQIEVEMQNEELTLANEIARAATEKYEELYDFAPSGYFTLSRNGSIVEINLRGAQMLGKERSLLINSQFAFFIKEDSRLVFANFLDEIFRGKSHVNCDLPLIPIGDISLHVHLTGIMSDTKEQCRITAVDITERKNAEDDLRKNLAKYKVLIETFPIAITISDPEGKIIETNEKALELLGLSREEHLKRKLTGEEWTIIKPDGKVFPQDEYASEKALKENRLVENVEMGIVKPGEETTWLNVTAAPIPIEDHGVMIAYNDITPRRQMENALFENEERLRLALQATNDVVWDWDIVNDSQRWNEAGKKVFGWTEIVEKTVNVAWWMERIHPDDRKRIEEGIDEVVKNKSGDKWQDEYRFRKADGTYAEVLDRGNFLRDDAGKPIRMIGAMLDITDRRNAEKLIKENEYKFRTVADFTSDLEYWQLPDGQLNYISPSCERITGYSRSEFISNPDLLVKIVHHDDLAKFLEHCNLDNAGNSDFFEKEINFRIIKKDSAIIWIEHFCRAVFDDNNTYKGKRVSLRDITKRNNAELALKESELLAHSIANTTPSLLYLYDLEKEKNIWTNEAHKRFFEDLKKDSSDFDFTEISQFTHPDDFKELIRLADETLNNFSINHYEFEHRLKWKDSWRWMKLFVSVFKRDSNGKPIQILGALFDIDEQKKTAQDLLEAKHKAEENEAYFRNIFENSAVGKSITGLDGSLKTNKAFSRMLGYSLEEFQAQNIFAITHSDDIKKSKDAVDVLLNGEKQQVKFEKRYIHKNGSVVFADVVTSLQKDRNSKPLFFITSINDITERKHLEKIREIQYNIATAGVTSDNIEQLLEFTRVQLSQILDTTNFFAALYNEKTNTFKKLHWVDEADDFVEWEAPQSFSGYVVQTGKTLLLNKQEIAKLSEEQNIPITGKPSECWLGVPLIVDKKAIGVLVIQSYTDPNAFDTSSAMLFEQLAYYLSAFIEKTIILQDLNDAKLHSEESEQRLFAFINSVPDVTCYKDGDGKWLLANEADLKLFCLTGVDYFGKTDRELAAYTNELYMDSFLSCMETDEISWNKRSMSKGIEVIPTPDGGSKTFEVYKIPSFHQNGERKGLAVIGRDISELYETQQNLLLAKQKAEESEEKFRTLSENSPAIIYRILLKPSMRFDYVSPAVTEISGYTPEEHYADPDLGFKLVHPEDRHILENSMHKTQGEPVVLRWIKKDGKIMWTEQRNVLIFDKDGNPFAIEGIATDITAQKEADAKVAFQANMLSQISEAVIATDLEGVITYWNNSAEKLYGWKQEEVLGKNITDVTPTSATKDQTIEIFNSLSKGQSFTGEFMVKCKDGHSFPAIVNDSPIYDSQNQLLGIVGISSDITERKLYEAEIHKLNEELEQRVVNRTAQLEAANKELEAFSYSVSHDLRTPLRALNGFATILTEDYSMALDDEGKRLLSVISENATKMGCLIDDLLSFSRLGRIEMLPSLINMKTMAETVYNELVPETEKDKIRFALGNIPAAPGDPSMVKQVWVNLIGNAIKFTSKKTDRHIEIGVITGENENIYFVKDNGAGFEMAKATKLFSVFQRLHTLKEFDGTGAGLAIVRRIILRHNGRVCAEGKVNEGATFYFTLPSGE